MPVNNGVITPFSRPMNFSSTSHHHGHQNRLRHRHQHPSCEAHRAGQDRPLRQHLDKGREAKEGKPGEQQVVAFHSPRNDSTRTPPINIPRPSSAVNH